MIIATPIFACRPAGFLTERGAARHGFMRVQRRSERLTGTASELALRGAGLDDAVMTEFTNPGMPEYFGIRITSAEKDKLVGELDADQRHVNRGGHVHGGTLAAFGDDLGGTLAGLNVAAGFRTTTVESKINILRACLPGRLVGVSVPIHVGRRTIVLQTSIYRPDGKLAALMTQTQMVLPRDPAAQA